jgi:hypothetical protein
MPLLGWTRNVRPQATAYAAALAIPVGITYAVAWLGWPPFIFEHLVVLLPLAPVQRQEDVVATVTQPVPI